MAELDRGEGKPTRRLLVRPPVEPPTGFVEPHPAVIGLVAEPADQRGNVRRP